MKSRKKTKIAVMGPGPALKKATSNFGTIANILAKYADVTMLGHKEKGVKGFEPNLKFKKYTKIERDYSPIIDYPLGRLLRVFLDTLFFHIKEKPDAVVSVSREDLDGVVNILLSKMFGKKSIIRLSGDLVDAYKNKPNAIYRWAVYLLNNVFSLSILRFADVIITMSTDVKKKMVKLGYDPKKIHIIMQYLDYSEGKLGKFDKAGLKLDKNKRNVLIAGTVSKMKGAESIKYLVKDPKIVSKYNFIFAGEDKGGYVEKFKGLNSITLLGRIDRETMMKYYNSVDLLIHASHNEGFPKVLTEAYSTGCPVVARRICGMERLAQYSFLDDKELKKILLEKDFKRSKKIDWPEEFKHETIFKRYNDVVESI